MVGIIILLEETTKARESLCEGVSHLSEKQKREHPNTLSASTSPYTLDTFYGHQHGFH
jgi:hypothetical protein